MNKENILYTCCFFGHRKVPEATEIKNRIYEVVEKLIINKNVSIFLFGSKSEFDDLCYKAVTELKEKYPHIKRIYVRAEFQHINDSFKKRLLEKYEDTYYPKHIENSGKASYVERNQEMINNANYCIIYYNKSYIPTKRKNSKRDLTEYQPKSGTRIAYDFAVKKKKEIVNLY